MAWFDVNTKSSAAASSGAYLDSSNWNLGGGSIGPGAAASASTPLMWFIAAVVAAIAFARLVKG